LIEPYNTVSVKAALLRCAGCIVINVP